MYDIDDINDIVRCVHVSSRTNELKDNFSACYKRTLYLYRKLVSKRFEFLESLECSLDHPKSRCQFDLTEYGRTYYEFVDSYNDLSQLAYVINGGSICH